MARTPKTLPVLTAAEKKAAKVDLKAALNIVNAEHAKYVSDAKAATKAHDALVKATAKTTTVSIKAVEAAQKKLEKATVAAEAGRAKIAAKLAALEPAPVNNEPATA